MKPFIIGIDNGLSGGVVSLHPDGRISMASAMPVTEHHGRAVVDVKALSILLRSPGPGRVFVVVERPGGSKSAHAAVSMAASYHAIRATIEVLGIEWASVTPREWQKRQGFPWAGKDTKAAALALARTIWPKFDWRASPRCRVPHDGIVDAALIAHAARAFL